MVDIMLHEVKRLHDLYKRVRKSKGSRFKTIIENSRIMHEYTVYGVKEQKIPEMFARVGLTKEDAEHFMKTSDLFFGGKEPGDRIFLPSGIAKYIDKKYAPKK